MLHIKQITSYRIVGRFNCDEFPFYVLCVPCTVFPLNTFSHSCYQPAFILPFYIGRFYRFGVAAFMLCVHVSIFLSWLYVLRLNVSKAKMNIIAIYVKNKNTVIPVSYALSSIYQVRSFTITNFMLHIDYKYYYYWFKRSWFESFGQIYRLQVAFQRFVGDGVSALRWEDYLLFSCTQTHVGVPTWAREWFCQ